MERNGHGWPGPTGTPNVFRFSRRHRPMTTTASRSGRSGLRHEVRAAARVDGATLGVPALLPRRPPARLRRRRGGARRAALAGLGRALRKAAMDPSSSLAGASRSPCRCSIAGSGSRPRRLGGAARCPARPRSSSTSPCPHRRSRFRPRPECLPPAADTGVRATVPGAHGRLPRRGAAAFSGRRSPSRAHRPVADSGTGSLRRCSRLYRLDRVTVRRSGFGTGGQSVILTQ
jgi:hypothetical protein